MHPWGGMGRDDEFPLYALAASLHALTSVTVSNGCVDGRTRQDIFGTSMVSLQVVAIVGRERATGGRHKNPGRSGRHLDAEDSTGEWLRPGAW
jgi:hypothetical protein